MLGGFWSRILGFSVRRGRCGFRGRLVFLDIGWGYVCRNFVRDRSEK